jgi:hypothetical protein
MGLTGKSCGRYGVGRRWPGSERMIRYVKRCTELGSGGRQSRGGSLSPPARFGEWIVSWPPAGNDHGALTRLGIIGDAREKPAQLDGGRELTALLEGGSDRGGFGFGYNEHAVIMGSEAAAGKDCFI